MPGNQLQDERAAPTDFGRMRAAAHWLLAGAMMLMLAGGVLGLARLSDADPAKVDLLRGHMIGGMVTLGALIFYMIAAMATRRPAKLPSGNAALNVLAWLVHRALLLCALILVSSGIATVSMAGLADLAFGDGGGRIPDFVQAMTSFEVHRWTARALLALLILHVIGALFHQIVLRDGIFRRMTPWRGAAVRAPIE